MVTYALGMLARGRCRIVRLAAVMRDLYLFLCATEASFV